MLERLNRYRERVATGKIKEKPTMMEALRSAIHQAVTQTLAKDYVDCKKGGKIDVTVCITSIDDISELVCAVRISFTDIFFKDGGRSVGHNRRHTDVSNVNPNVAIKVVADE